MYLEHVSSARVHLMVAAFFVGSSAAGAQEILFGEPVFFAPGVAVIAVEAGDVDGDAAPDLIVPGISDFLSVLRNDGSAGFDSVAIYTAPFFHLELATGDLDGDDDLDVVLANGLIGADDSVSVFLNLGDGTFADAMLVATPNVPTPRGVGVADMDGDGDLDIVVGDGFVDRHAVLLNDGAADFSEASSFSGGATSLEVGLGDLDGDGDTDVVFAFGGVSVHLNRGDATFESPFFVLTGNGPTSVAVADLDGDRDNDIAVSFSSGLSQTVVLLNDGDGRSYKRSDYAVDQLPRDIALADLDADCDLDVVTSNVAPSNTISVLANRGDGTFEPARHIPAGNYPQSLALADFDGDLRVDVATANEFADPPDVGIMRNETAVEVADCNGNRVPDRCDILDATSRDCDADTVPDECSGVLSLEQSPIVRGEPLALTVRGAAAGDRVIFLASVVGEGCGPCIGAGERVCLDLLTPRVLGAARAGADGIAALAVRIPGGFRADELSTQALVRASGGAPAKSNAVTAPVTD